MRSGQHSQEGMGHRHHHKGGDPARAARHEHDQSVFHELLRRHDSLRREVENLPNGIRSVTETDDPALVPLLQEHVHEMHRRLEEGFGLRHWDAAFVEIFAQKDKVKMQITDTEKGVVVTETSDDPNVVKLIQAHGVVVSAFVNSGGQAASQPSPLPDDYVRVAS